MEDQPRKRPQQLIQVPGYSVPPSLRDYYEYVGSTSDQSRAVLRCVYCKEEKYGACKSTGNFKRHLELLHNKEYSEKESKKQKTLDASVAVFRQQQRRTQKIPLSHDMQQAFNRYVAEMVALDGLPLSVTRGLGFQRLIEFLKPEVNMVSPRTIGRVLEELATKIALPSLCDTLAECPARALHFIVDLWTGRTRDAVLGTKVQFIENWQIRTCTLAFHHFPGRHTGALIREAFEAQVRERGIQQSQIGAVVCDNASNMTKAFNMSTVIKEKWTVRHVDLEQDEEDPFPEDSSTSELDVSEALTPRHRVRCAAHTLQLAVNAALKQDNAAHELLELLNHVIIVFRRSPYWTGRLKELCERDVVPTSGTRWNSTLAALGRLTQDGVYSAVEILMLEYNEENPSKSVEIEPPVFTLQRLQELYGLLRPLGDATDRLQGDGMTAGILHLSVATCYAQVKNYPTESFQQLQTRLLREVSDRFTDLLKDDLLVAASVLNPRQKLRVFQPTLAPGLQKPSATDAVAAVHRLLKCIQCESTTAETPEVASTSTSTSEATRAIADVWDATDIYDVLDIFSPIESTEDSQLDSYLKAGYSSDDPLEFWKKNQGNYADLARLARVCLGVPASSGSVERLFSVSGSLQRARRASLVPKTIEQLVMVAEHIKSKVGH